MRDRCDVRSYMPLPAPTTPAKGDALPQPVSMSLHTLRLGGGLGRGRTQRRALAGAPADGICCSSGHAFEPSTDTMRTSTCRLSSTFLASRARTSRHSPDPYATPWGPPCTARPTKSRARDGLDLRALRFSVCFRKKVGARSASRVTHVTGEVCRSGAPRGSRALHHFIGRSIVD